jgi:hypothetical protein
MTKIISEKHLDQKELKTNNMNDRIDANLFSEEAVIKAREAAHAVLQEEFGMPYMARCRDYPNLDDLKRADQESDEKNEAAVALVVNAVIAALQKNLPDVAEQIREARASELEDFAVLARVPKNRLSDTYTMRTIAEAATLRAKLIRRGDQ